MASNRWVAIDPDILTHPLVGAGQAVEPADPSRGAYSRMEAWVWLICNASFQDHSVFNRGRKMTLRRGDLLGAWAFLAHQWNWSVKTVRTWVEKLIADSMLQRRTVELQMEHNKDADTAGTDKGKQKGNQAQVLTIRNYWRYQYEPMGEGQAPWLAEGQAKGNQRASEGQHITKEQGNKGTQQQETTTAVAHATQASGGSGVLDELNGSAVNLMAFIAKHNRVDEHYAREMLATNVQIYGAQPLMDAFAATIAKMATRVPVPRPYQYLLSVARKFRDEKASAPEKKESMGDKTKRLAEEAAARYDRGAPL